MVFKDTTRHGKREENRRDTYFTIGSSILAAKAAIEPLLNNFILHFFVSSVPKPGTFEPFQGFALDVVGVRIAGNVAGLSVANRLPD